MENVNTTSTFEASYLLENSVTHSNFFSRPMLEALGVHSANQFRAEMDKLLTLDFYQDTIFLHPAQMEALRQDTERDATPSWHNSRYNQSIPPMEIPIMPRIRSYENNSERRNAIATLFEERLDFRGLAPISNMSPNFETLRGTTTNRIIIDDPEEEVYTPYRTRRTENKSKLAQVLLNDIKNYLQAYHDNIVDAETTLGALNGIYALIINLYGHDTFFKLPSKATSINTWSVKDGELIIHEANFATLCQWLHKQR